MKAIQFHIIAIKNTISSLIQGKFLYFFIPGIIIGLIFWQFFSVTENIQDSLASDENNSWIGSLFSKGVKGSFGFINFILEQIYIFIILTVLSPVNTILSERVDTSVTGKEYPLDLFQILSDVIRMVFIVIIAISLEFIFIGIYWVISWLFGLDLIDETMYFLIAAFFYGFSFYDYSLERYNIGVLGSLGFAFSKMLMVLLTGSIFLVVYKIPYVGIVFAPVLTTIISTYVYLQSRPKTLSINNE